MVEVAAREVGREHDGFMLENPDRKIPPYHDYIIHLPQKAFAHYLNPFSSIIPTMGVDSGIDVNEMKKMFYENIKSEKLKNRTSREYIEGLLRKYKNE